MKVSISSKEINDCVSEGMMVRKYFHDDRHKQF